MVYKIKGVVFFFATILSQFSFGQLSWHYLSNTPPPPNLEPRYEDVYFINDTVGWACSLEDIIATTNGGQTWTVQKDSVECRNIKFLTNKIGFAGALNDTCFYKTTDGGLHWNNIANLLPDPNKNICGMAVINASTLYAVGFWGSPARFFKTTDTGKTWSVEIMDSLAVGLVEARFIDSLHGFISGQANDSKHDGIILQTNDGGKTWKKVFDSDRSDELCWKMEFLADTHDSLGYASIESNYYGYDSSFIAKTTDGGNTWTKKFVCKTNIDMEGIGFINDTLGWVGGWSQGAYQTTDGGNTWSYLNFGTNLNRFFYIRPDLMYASGLSIYKYDNSTTGIAFPTSAYIPHQLLPCQPNPFSNITTINFIISASTLVSINVYNSKGEFVTNLVHGYYALGKYSTQWSCRSCASGEYIIAMGTSQRYLSEKVILSNEK